MQPTTPEIEQIIRVVMQRLAAAGDLMAGVGQLADQSDLVSELVIRERVVTLATIEKQIEGKRRLRVQPRAVVTPAVADLLRSQKIELRRDVHNVEQLSPIVPHTKLAQLSPTVPSIGKRGTVEDNSTTETKPTVTKPAPILVCGSATWFGSLSRHLCPKQALVHACDDALAPGLIQTHLVGGGRRGLWLTSSPFAASVAISRAACCTAVLLPTLRELGDALAQANPQLFIVDSPRWTVAAIGNLVRTLVKHPIGASEAGPRSTK